MAKKRIPAYRENPEVYRACDPQGVYTQILSGYGPIMSTKEVAEFLSCTRQRVSEMCRLGQIPDVPGTGTGKRRVWLIPKLSLIRYLNCDNVGGAGKDE